MNEIQEKWVEALRSGKYLQGKDYLRARFRGSRTDSFCCLGVLCELAVEAGVIPPGKREGSEVNVVIYGDNQHSFLPLEVVDWAGLTTDGREEVVLRDPFVTSRLVDLNDRGASFTEIADAIEINAFTLFVPEPADAERNL